MKALTNSFFSMLFLIFFLVGVQTYAQSTILKLPTMDNSSSFDITQSDSTNILRLFGDGGFYLGGTYDIGMIPIEGEGAHLMWYPGRGAFRVGYVDGTQWDNTNMGSFSMAMGLNTTASGTNSTAMGWATIASGSYSIAMGGETIAGGSYSTALGKSTTANGYASTALGNNTTASETNSTAMGLNTTASGTNSTAIGFYTIASGDYSTAIGKYVSTNNYDGSFIIGDASIVFGDTTYSSAQNQMTMRFEGGYKLFTNSNADIGALLNAGANSWTTISDSTKKENFIYADGEQFLKSLSRLKLGSWNYRTQEVEQFRHYGPMAQEIFHYFGKDKLGTIGNDTTLSTADMDGIMMICLQALETRTKDLKKATEKISELENKISDFTNEFIEMKKTFLKLEENESWSSKMVSN